jgi:hypothetical protein
MANADVNDRMERGQRPHATVRYSQKAEQQAPARKAPRPRFSRIDAGQFIRTVILVILALGVFQLSHAEKADAEGRGAAAFEKRT